MRAAAGPRRGLVQAYANAVAVEDARFMVSEAGRQRVLRERVKNVHAHVRGATRILIDESGDVTGLQSEMESLVRDGLIEAVGYNPYYTPTFINRATRAPVFEAAQVVVIGHGIYVARAALKALS